ncbi:MAG: HAMP domain-containing sensor histidine kinase, partial [Oscillospiraceae bacterium]
RSFAKGDFSQKVSVKGYDEIAQLAMSFNYMADALENFEKTRRSFVANISHDLRTPMTTIGGFIDGILDGTIPPEKQKHYLGIVSEEIKRLAKLVRVMMNVAKIEAGEIILNKTDWNLFDAVCKIMFTFEQKVDAKQLDIRGLEDIKLIVNADLDLINQVIYNLIDNAVKFVNQDGFIEFDFKAKGNMAYLSISNSGDAIKKEDLTKIFDRFYKSDKSRGMDKAGVGLGLYIVKSIINAHGGDIIVNSVENKYCTFTFTVPLAQGCIIKEKNNSEETFM